MNKLAILIPVYNSLSYTKEAIANLKNEIANSQWKLKEDIFIVVIDDNSSDGTFEFISNNYPEVDLAKGDGNLWWSGAINLGARMAFNELECNYVLLWNNDIITEKGYFNTLFEIINNEPDSQIFGSKIYIKDKNQVWFMGGIFKTFSGKKNMIGHRLPDSEEFNKITECDWLTGMGTVVNKSVTDKIGYWDQVRFPQYHGDSDFSLRAKKNGFKIKVFPQLKIYNDISNTGMYHKKTFKSLFQSLKSIKSDFNLSKDILFYRIHTTGPFAYCSLFIKYFKYIGGFIKQKYFSFK